MFSRAATAFGSKFYVVLTSLIFSIIFLFIVQNVHAAATGTITADPNPCQVSNLSQTCSSNIKMKMTGAPSADVCVTIGSTSPGYFAQIGPDKEVVKEAPWITDTNYTFSMRVPSNQCSGTQTEIAKVVVTGNSNVTGKLSANPNPCNIAENKDVCDSTISYSFTGTPTADVCVSPAGGKDQLFSQILADGGNTQTKVAPWISVETYTFKIRVPHGNCSGKVIETLDVTGKRAGGPTGNITANPNPCQIEKDKDTCDSTISYNITQKTADVCVSPAGGKDQLFSQIVAGQNYDKVAPWISEKEYKFKVRVPHSGKCDGVIVAAVTVTGQKEGETGGVPTKNIPTITPETGVKELVVVNTIGAAVLGYFLSRYGKHKSLMFLHHRYRLNKKLLKRTIVTLLFILFIANAYLLTTI